MRFRIQNFIMIVTRAMNQSVGISRISILSVLVKSRPFTLTARVAIEKKKEDLKPEGRIKWFYATDIPLSKPSWFNYTKTEDPQKFIPFSDYDSRKIEKQYRKYYCRSGNEEVLTIVEVSEDRLFQVDVRELHLSPVYWEGPVYEVRRGLWFSSDGIPLKDSTAKEIELGYEQKKPYLFDQEKVQQASQNSPNKAEIAKFNSDIKEELLQSIDIDSEENDDIYIIGNGKAVLYFSDTRAVIFPDTMVNTFQLPIIRKFGISPVALMDVIHIQRGYTSDLSASIFENISNNNPIPGLSEMIPKEAMDILTGQKEIKKSTNYSNEGDGNDKKLNKEMESVIEDDFENDTSKNTANREIDHLILCVHGIGQVLGSKYESINFAHSINVMRNMMKSVYKDNPKFKKLAYPDKEKGIDVESNNRIQVLPISWRHKIEFHPNKVPSDVDESRLPTLSQINVDGVKSLRNIIGDVALDILLYYESRYFNQILESVTLEINRAYKLYMERNPDFKGKVHILGHSLGSAIAFDICSRQYNKVPDTPDEKIDLLFDVDDLFCIGCPVGVFKLLSQQNIVNRKDLEADFNPRDESLTFASPKCNEIYNLYHPCDPIGYRIEPLIKPRFAAFKAEEAPFAVDGISSQIKGLATFTDDLQNKFSQATSWFLKKNKNDKLSGGIADAYIDENALGDIVSSIVKSDEPDKQEKAVGEMSAADLKELTKFNRGARVDYCLPMGVFDISLVSAISAHVSYFEDKDTAGFIMGELLLNRGSPVTTKKVLYQKD